MSKSHNLMLSIGGLSDEQFTKLVRAVRRPNDSVYTARKIEVLRQFSQSCEHHAIQMARALSGLIAAVPEDPSDSGLADATKRARAELAAYQVWFSAVDLTTPKELEDL